MEEQRHDAIREAIRERGAGARLRRGRVRRGAARPRQARADLAEFLARGYHGDMGWLAATAARRGDPQTLWPEARTVVVLGLNYGADDDPLAAIADPSAASVSVYARGRDYHDTLKRRLKALGALDRRALAGRAQGLCRHRAGHGKAAGAAGRARLAGQAHQPRVARIRLVAVSRRNLSEPRARARRAPRADHCGTCRRCLDCLPDRGVSRRPTGSMRGAASRT